MIVFAEIVATGAGIWSVAAAETDPDLLRLAEQLPEVMAGSKAPSTVRMYESGFKRWKTWAACHEAVLCLPARPYHVALYLLSVAQNVTSPSSIDSAMFSIAWAHNISALEDPCKSGFVKEVASSLKRKLSGHRTKKEVFTVDLLEKFEMLSRPKNCINRIRLLVVCLLSFACFLRFDEVSQLKLKHITFEETHVILFIEKSKTDQLREGKKVFMSKSCSDLCPVENLKNYLSVAKVTDPDEYIFRAICTNKEGVFQLRKLNNPISYTRMRELFVEGLKAVGEDPTKFGLHSLRAGGATVAACTGTSDRLLKRHGRWKTDNAKDGYIKEDINELLSVTKNMGL